LIYAREIPSAAANRATREFTRSVEEPFGLDEALADIVVAEAVPVGPIYTVTPLGTGLG